MKNQVKCTLCTWEKKKHEDPDLVTASHHEMLTSLLGSEEEALKSVVYSYKHGFSGFAAWLTESQANNIAELPEVVSVMPNRVHRLQTTRSWDFLGLNYYQSTGLLSRANYGDGVIIGIIDSGVWPESRSFSDHGYGPIPSRWKGKCVVEPTFGANNCSRKIVGARYYAGGVSAENLEGEYMSPRDFNTHGTHTASTAAGVPVSNASFHGLGAGMVRGGAPRARLAIYKACWGQAGECYDSTVLKAFDDAIHDGVDIISLSIHGDGYPAGSLPAVMKGITVAFIAGNEGPVPQTLNNEVPWVITVAASSIDRSFPTVITLGNNKKLVGQGAFYRPDKDQFKELVYGKSCDEESLNGTNVVGKYVLCFDLETVYTTIPRQVMATQLGTVLRARAKGVIFGHYTSFLMDYLLQCQGLPCIAVDVAIAGQIEDYIDSVGKPMVKIEPTRSVVGQVQSPSVASFSSRGPSTSYPELLKPDIAAPGTNILAALGDSYGFDSGTSMACPHVAGIAALLKSSHPDWSPAAIKSAIITTASVTDRYGQPIMAEGVPRKLADPFDYGGGQINPNNALDPGLVYDINPKEYLKFFKCTFGLQGGCDPKQRSLYHLNLPSIAIPNLRQTVMVQRAVTNVGKVDAVVYKAALEIPPGIKMVVQPSVLAFNARSKVQTFNVTFMPTHKAQGFYGFGSLTWFDGTHSVRIPIAVRTIIQDFYADTF
uniref:Subtilisin-like protease SBT3.5 n=1 Tax=Elaeis guineensis var. tenera TaxID=51953 RepID=A0A6I9RXC9_ELAGV|nr:subtilisin-like protease SBT3.5 [Elaeis guineensis]